MRTGVGHRDQGTVELPVQHDGLTAYGSRHPATRMAAIKVLQNGPYLVQGDVTALDRNGASYAIKAMMQMKKLDQATLQLAYDGE